MRVAVKAVVRAAARAAVAAAQEARAAPQVPATATPATKKRRYLPQDLVKMISWPLHKSTLPTQLSSWLPRFMSKWLGSVTIPTESAIDWLSPQLLSRRRQIAASWSQLWPLNMVLPNVQTNPYWSINVFCDMFTSQVCVCRWWCVWYWEKKKNEMIWYDFVDSGNRVVGMGKEEAKGER